MIPYRCPRTSCRATPSRSRSQPATSPTSGPLGLRVRASWPATVPSITGRWCLRLHPERRFGADGAAALSRRQASLWAPRARCWADLRNVRSVRPVHGSTGPQRRPSRRYARWGQSPAGIRYERSESAIARVRRFGGNQVDVSLCGYRLGHPASRRLVRSLILAAYALSSDPGSPNHGSTVFSKRVAAQIRSPVRVRTKRPTPWLVPSVRARRPRALADRWLSLL